MLKLLGFTILTFGLIMIYAAWGVKDYPTFIIELIGGPILIDLGIQLLK
jgi:hypothetical protein